MKRVFGLVEALFDILYLAAATIIGVILLLVAQDNLPRTLAGIMALVLVGGRCLSSSAADKSNPFRW